MPEYTPTSNYYTDKGLDWTSYDDIPWDTWNPRGTGTMPQHMVDLVIAHNRGDADYSGSGAPSTLGNRRNSGYGSNEGPTMGIQQGGPGSIPGGSTDYNQLMAVSRAKNNAIKDFGGWDAWTEAGSPEDIFAGLNLPDVGALRNQAGGPGSNFGAPAPNQGGPTGGQPGGQPGGQTDGSGYLNMPAPTGGGTEAGRFTPMDGPGWNPSGNTGRGSPSDWFAPGPQTGTTGIQRGFNPFGTGDLGQFSTPTSIQAAQAAALRG